MGGVPHPAKKGFHLTKEGVRIPLWMGGVPHPTKEDVRTKPKGKGDNNMDLDVITEKMERMMGSTIVMIPKMMPTGNAEGLTRTKN